MSILQTEIPSPRQAISALRKRSSESGASQPRHRSARAGRLPSRSIVGLDIEPGFIAAVETLPNSSAVRHAAFTEIDPDLVRDGEVVDPEALGEVLRAFFAEHKLSPRVRIGLANQRIVMRTIDLPPITDERQLASAIRFQAQEHIAMPLEQAVLEHQSLGLVGTPDGPRSRVVLVAARKEMVERLLTATQQAGLRLEGVDLSAFALIRALHRLEDDAQHAAYINVEAMTNLAVASGTQCLFTRVIPTGTAAIVSDLTARRGLTTEHARGWLRHVGLSRPLEAIEGDPQIVRATREALLDGVSRIASEVRATLNFYATQGDGITERAIVTGTAASLEGFPERLAEELGLPVEARIVAEGQADAFTGLQPAQLSVAAGLTLTEVPA